MADAYNGHEGSDRRSVRVRPDSADPGLLLKATPPRVAKWLIAREQLALSRPELAESPVLTVHAPSGFGKTSLLSQWR